MLFCTQWLFTVDRLMQIRAALFMCTKPLLFSPHLLCTIIPGPSLPLSGSPHRIHMQTQERLFPKSEECLSACTNLIFLVVGSPLRYPNANICARARRGRFLILFGLNTYTIDRRFICAFYGSIFQHSGYTCLTVNGQQ
jgi:hypothetical protein